MNYDLHLKAIQHWQSKKTFPQPLIKFIDDKSDDTNPSSTPCKDQSTSTENTLETYCPAHQNDADIQSSENILQHISNSSSDISTFWYDMDKIDQRNGNKATSKHVCSDHSGHIHQIYQNLVNFPSTLITRNEADDETPNDSSRTSENIFKADIYPLLPLDEITRTRKPGELIGQAPGALEAGTGLYSEMIGDEFGYGGAIFKRFFGNLTDCQLEGKSKAVMERRIKSAKNLELAEHIFKDLEAVEEWNSDHPVPSANQLTPNDIDRIKKGMLNGKLYNIGYDHIKEIFPASSLKSFIPSRESFHPGSCFRCPLCPTSYRGSNHVQRHIESLHTSGQFICVNCGAIFTSQRNCSTHRCKSALSHNASRNPTGLLLCPSQDALQTLPEPFLPRDSPLTIGSKLPLKRSDDTDANSFKQSSDSKILYDTICSSSQIMNRRRNGNESRSRQKLSLFSEHGIQQDNSKTEGIRDQIGEVQWKSEETSCQRRSSRLSSLRSAVNPSLSQKMKKRRTVNESKSRKKLSISSAHGIQRAEVCYSHYGSFKRFEGLIDDSEMHGSFGHAIDRRKKTVNRLILDENVFQGLDKVKEWDEKQMIPSLDRMTPYHINRIKKGMANGRLYNLCYHYIQKIFPDLSSSPHSAPNSNHRGSARLKCPMCSSDYEYKCRVHEHIESVHTMALMSCVHCESLFTTHFRSQSHQCSKLKRKPKPEKEQR